VFATQGLHMLVVRFGVIEHVPSTVEK
jgi:hypothetical protein